VAELIAGMFVASRYKRSQGKVARQLTFAAMALGVAVGAWNLNSISADDIGKYVIPLAVLSAGLWASFRIVNLPRFADFLISVEAEMNKVSWPSRPETWRASVVVIFVIFFLAALLFAYDFVLDVALNWMFGL
jgi:preprotein translocase subunit SecE